MENSNASKIIGYRLVCWGFLQDGSCPNKKWKTDCPHVWKTRPEKCNEKALYDNPGSLAKVRQDIGMANGDISKSIKSKKFIYSFWYNGHILYIW